MYGIVGTDTVTSRLKTGKSTTFFTVCFMCSLWRYPLLTLVSGSRRSWSHGAASSNTGIHYTYSQSGRMLEGWPNTASLLQLSWRRVDQTGVIGTMMDGPHGTNCLPFAGAAQLRAYCNSIMKSPHGRTVHQSSWPIPSPGIHHIISFAYNTKIIRAHVFRG
jgi:hypothetical protein